MPVTRRGFVRAALAAGVTIALPPAPACGARPLLDEAKRIADCVPARAAFDPNGEYGRAFDWRGGDLPAPLREELLQLILKDARSALPPGAFFELRERIPRGNRHGIAWYYCKYLGTGAIGLSADGGHYLLSQHYA